MRPKARGEVFTADEMRQLYELGNFTRGIKGSKQKVAAAMSSLSPDQRDLIIRWVAYRLGGGR